jgi:hypothetical protein
VRAYLGAACTVAEPVDLEAAFPSTSPSTPVVLITTHDQPLPQLMALAEARCIKVCVCVSVCVRVWVGGRGERVRSCWW